MPFALLTAAVAYAGVLGFLYACQRLLIYHPDKFIQPPEYYGLEDFSEYFVDSTEGVTLQLWYRPAKAGKPTILYYHGNAANLSDRAGKFAAFAEKGFGVLAVSYRGYGKSTGNPSEQGIYDDARTAIRFLTNEQNIPIKDIFLFGESLGSGVAVQMATEFDVAGVMLEAPYTSVAARAAEIYFYIPVNVMIEDKFDSLGKIGNVKAPLLIFHGELDTVIPIAMGRALFAAANEPKQAIYYPHVGHTDFDTQELANEVEKFTERYWH